MEATTLLKAKIESKLILAMAELRKPEGTPLVSVHQFDAHHLYALCLDAMLAASQLIDTATAGGANHG